MKNRWRFSLLLCLATLCVSACNWFIDDGESAIPVGVIFYTNNPVVFYFMDEDGADLVNVDKFITYPQAYHYEAGPDIREMAIRSLQTIDQGGISYHIYNESSNFVYLDSTEQRYAFQTYLWGRTVETEISMFIYSDARVATPDSLHMKYEYLLPKTDNDLGGASWGVEVKSITYNGVEVFQGNEKGKVFIEKPSHGGKTVVHVGTI